MKLKAHQWAELAGIFFLLASTATQIFYVEPLRREIEWRLAAFQMQQNGQLQIRAIYDTRLAVLRALQSPESEIATAETDRKVMVERYQTADANIADYLISQEPVENILQIGVLALFAIGSLLAGYGRVMDMIAGRRVE